MSFVERYIVFNVLIVLRKGAQEFLREEALRSGVSITRVITGLIQEVAESEEAQARAAELFREISQRGEELVTVLSVARDRSAWLKFKLAAFRHKLPAARMMGGALELFARDEEFRKKVLERARKVPGKQCNVQLMRRAR